MDKNNIVEVNENEFESKVINASENKLIIVDFWAPWCGPCKQLTPMMEKIANEHQDDFTLVKVNIDDNQQIAAQLRIQSIPAVFAFKEKKIVNAFQGVISEKDFIDFIEKSNGKKLKEDLGIFYDEVKELIFSKNFEEAKSRLLEFFSENANNAIAINLYLECLLAQKNFNEIEEFLTSLDDKMKKNQDVLKIIKKIKIVKESKKAVSIDLLLEELKKDEKNIGILFKVSEYYFAEEDYDNAFSILIKNYQKDKEKIKKKLVEFFEALGDDHESTKTYRKQLSSLLFS